jgi:hypothetical protein
MQLNKKSERMGKLGETGREWENGKTELEKGTYRHRATEE